MSINIDIGDWVEVKGDYGCVTNAPWTNKVVDIKDGKYFFNEGTANKPYLVGYKLNEDNFTGFGKNPYSNNAKVFIFSH